MITDPTKEQMMAEIAKHGKFSDKAATNGIMAFAENYNTGLKSNLYHVLSEKGDKGAGYWERKLEFGGEDVYDILLDSFTED